MASNGAASHLSSVGWFPTNETTNSFIYHPTLNVIVLITKDSKIKVVDLHSSQTLHHGPAPNSDVFGAYLPGVDKLLLCDGRAVGVRRDHSGTLLLESILQPPVVRGEDTVKLDIPLSEATVLAQALKQVDMSALLPLAEDAAVAARVQETLQHSLDTLDTDRIACNPKAVKWCTVCLDLPLHQLRSVFSALLAELLRAGRHVPALAYAAAAVERLHLTLAGGEPASGAGHPPQPDRRRMFSEAARRQTFSRWPHMHYKWALPDQMAQAGFYHQPNQSGDDMAMCFTCTACLVCWEPTDEPWSEHERHSPACPFVKGEHTENVALSVTESTEPAQLQDTAADEPVSLLAPSTVPHLVATGTRLGHVVVWGVSATLTRELAFRVDTSDPLIEPATPLAARERPATGFSSEDHTTAREPASVEREARVGALCLLAPPEESSPAPGAADSAAARPCLVAGVRLWRRHPSDAGGRANSESANTGIGIDTVLSSDATEEESADAEPPSYPHRPCLIVYDIKQQVAASGQPRSPAGDASVYSHPGGGHTKKLSAPPAAPDPDAFAAAADKDSELSDSLMKFLMSKDDLLSAPAAAADSVPAPAAAEPTLAAGEAAPAGCEPPSLLQCVPLPRAVAAAGLSVTSLQPSADGGQLLVLAAAEPGPDLLTSGAGGGGGGALLMYPLETTGAAVTLRPLPSVLRLYGRGQPHPVHVTVIPAEVRPFPEDEPPELDEGQLAVLLSSGELQLLSAATLETLVSLMPPGSRCLGTAYCNSLDCLIACYESGELKFVPLSLPGMSASEGSPGASRSAHANHMVDVQPPPASLVTQQPLSAAALTRAHELTRMETMTPLFSALVPPCWAEIQQAQKQRRHPRLMQSDRHHTRTWRLLNDGPAWKQHVFEITLPRSAPVAHVDFRFALQPLCTTMPHVEATLVRSSALPRQPGATAAAAEDEDAGADDAEVMCGPVDLRTCLDMSGQGGTATFTSTELLRAHQRTFSLRLSCASDATRPKASGDGAERSGAFFLPDLQAAVYGSAPVTVDKLAAAGVKADHITGCECFQEVSITIRRVKLSHLPHQRVQRTAMLEQSEYHASLLDAVCRRGHLDDPLYCQNVALDVLLWVAALRLMHNASTERTAPFVSQVEERLHDLVSACFLHGSRTLAHKCARLIVLCIEASRGVEFGLELFSTLVSFVPSTPGFQSPGALGWYFVLLNHTKRLMPQQAAAALMSLLAQVTRQLGSRADPLHDVLKTRYGLHGAPLEGELFDTESPCAAGETPPPAAGETPESALEPDLRDLLGPCAPGRSVGQTGRAGVWSALAADEQLRGLVEVEPLHYTCHATSDCTRLEWQPGAVPARLLGAGQQLTGHRDGLSTAKLEEAIADVEKKAAELQALVTQKPDQASGHLLHILQHVSREVAGARRLTEQLESSLTEDQQPETEPPAAASASSATAAHQLTDPMLSVLLSPWHHLLSPPSQHLLVIDRMHSGARRFVVIDFGAPVLLTDIIMPACADLLSISVDAWTQHEEADGQRLVVASDIGYRRLVMTGLQPPPVCRYLKITTIGRYGMTTTRCRIPMAWFYGRTVQMPWEVPDLTKRVRTVNREQAQAELGLLTTLYQEVHCQYSLACERLRRLLQALPPAADGAAPAPAPTASGDKVPAAYQECVTLQQQTAVVQSLVRRLRQYCRPAPATSSGAAARLRTASTSQLRRVCDHLLESLLSLTPEPTVTVQRAPAAPLLPLTPPLCRLLFSELCVHAAPRQQLAAGALLLAAASAQPWWGQLVADMFSRLFTHSEDRDFPRQRLFILLTYMGQRTMSRGGGQSRALLEALLGALCGHLAAEVVDLSLVEWMLLYLATLIEALVDSKETGRWRFLAGERALLRGNPGAASGRGYKGYRRRLLTRLKNHKQIDELLNVKKLTMGKSLASSNLIGFLVHSQPKSDCLKKKQFKYVKAGQGSDTRRDASTSTADSAGGGGGGGGPEPAAPVVGREVALRLVRHLMERLLDSQLMVSPEMMMTGCKVVSWAAAAVRPALGLCELVTPAQLDCLLRAASGTATVPLSWTGAWTGHTVQCFIQEVLLAERAHPAQWGGGSSSSSGPPEPPRPPVGPPPPETASAGDGSSAASSDGSGTPEDEEDDSPSPSNNAVLSSSDKLEVHMFSADGGGPPFSTYYPFPALSEAAGGPSPPAPPPATSAQQEQTPAAGADTAGEMYLDASQEAGVCLLPPMVESDDEADHFTVDDFMMDIFDASLGDKKPPLPSDAVKWGLIPAPGGSWSLSNAANSSGGLGKLGAGWLAHASGAAAAGGAGSSGGGGGAGGGACVLDILKAPAGAGAADLAGCSTASDARLEVGLTAWPELRLRKMAALHTGAVLQAVSGSLPTVPPPPGQAEPAAAPEEAPRMRGQDLVADGLAVIQTSLQYSATPASVESLLELWLALDCACTAGFQRALPVLLQSVRAAGRLSLRGWTLLFQALTARRSPDGPSARSNEQTADMLLSHDLVQAASPLGQVLIMFLTQSVADVPGKQECGATVCRWFDALLVSLMSVPAAPRWSVMLLELLWIAAHAPGFPEPGAPLDALSRLVQRMLQLNYPGTELGSIVGLVQVIVSSVHRHLSASEQARCGRGAESGPPESAAETLLVDLLRLAALLVCVPLRPGAGQSGESAPPQTDELKACSGGGGGGSPSPAATPRLPLRQLVVDRVLENSVIVEQLLLSASLVTVAPQETPERPDQEGSAVARPAGAALAAALGDLLSTLMTHSADRKQLARAIVTYLASRAGGCPPRISQLLLKFFLKVVNTDSAVASTIRHRGLEAVFENLMLSCRAVTPASGGVTSQMMRHISQRQRRPAGSANGPLRRAATPAAAAANALAQANRLEDVDGLINVAPLSTITCSNPMALQPEVLVQPTAPHRRSRNPAWSHHFYAADERAVELQVRLPCAVLLHQVQLQPHVSSLATCPSAVTVEVCSGGPAGPVCTSVPTAGLTFIGIELPRPTVATEVTVRLQRPADSNNLGLTQLRLLASTTFGTAPPGKADPASEECHLWLRLLDAALPSSADAETLDQLCGPPRLLERARALLAAAAARPDSAQRAGRLLLRLGRHKAELGLGLVRQLLRRPPAAGRQPVRLLYRLATTDDQFMANRVFELLTWVRESALGTDAAWPLGPLHASLVHCIAAILWKVASLSHEGVLLLIPTDLVTVVYDWCSRLPAGSRLKCALDWVLCALCHLQPPLLPPLLHTMGVMVTPGGRANATDDRKDMEAEACAAVSDDDKHGAVAPAAAPPLRLLPAQRLDLGAGQLATLACVLQAPAAALHAIDSGLLHAVLVQAVHGCCRELGGQDTASAAESSELVDLEEGLTDSDKQSRSDQQPPPTSQMPALLSLLSALCGEPCVRDWLSSDAAAVYWLSLPRLLAARPQRRLPAGLEPELLRLLARCCHGHPANQRRLAATVCDILAAQLEASAGCRPRLQGFTRRLVLRLLLESERVGVLLHQLPAAPETAGAHAQTAQHPRFWADQLLVVKTDITIAALLQTALGTESSSSPAAKERPTRSDKEQKNQANAAVVAEVDGPLAPPPLPGHHYKAKQEKKYLKKVRRSADPLSEPVPPEARYELVDLELSDQPLPPTITLSQLMTVRAARLPSTSPPPFLCLALRQRGAPDWQSPPPSREEGETAATLLSAAAFPSVLSVFAEEGGLALLAGTLPLLLPEGVAPPPAPSAGRTDRPPPADLTDAEWVKVDQTEEDEYVSSLMPLSGGGGSGGGAPAQAGGAALPPVMSPHSLACFGLFLRLPGYAELLLQDQVWARYLLRLALGVTDDGDGNEILRQDPAAELPLYPVHLMQCLLNATLLTTDDGQLLRRRCLEIGAFNFLLACTAVLSHTESAVPLPALEYQLILATTRNQLLSECQSQRVTEDRGHQYWAKGTGFGTGSTSQKWNVEQAMLKQKLEEEHVTWLIQTLASYINPRDAPVPADNSDCSTTDLLPEGLAERINESSILTAVCSYLRNDSVLDMARHVPLYRAILQLLRAFAGSRQLAPLLSQVAPLLANMRQVVDTYTSHLHSNKPRKGDKSSKSGAWPKEEEDGGLARLLTTIQDTSRLVSVAAAAPSPASPAVDRDAAAGAAAAAAPAGKSLQDIYLETMRKLQFDTHEMIVESPNGGTRFVVSHHFESTMRAAGERSHPARMKRLAQETVTLSTSLPLSFSSSVFVRVDLGRLDLMKVLITAPSETPYSNGCFLFDVYFPYDYPNAPMLINLDTTGRNTVRFNPNLYNDGKVCLSVLNTWHGRPEEKWSPQTSSFLQVLVSIQSLILVSEPYFNEPGYERSRGTPSGTQSSREYDANIRQATVRWAMLEQIRKPCPCFKEVIERHFYLKRGEIVEQVQSWITEMEGYAADRRASKTLHVSLQALKAHFAALQEELKKLRPPPDLEGTLGSDPTPADAAGPAPAGVSPSASQEKPTVGLSPSARPPAGLNAIPDLATAGAAASGVIEKVKSAAAAVAAAADSPAARVNGVETSGKR